MAHFTTGFCINQIIPPGTLSIINNMIGYSPQMGLVYRE